MLYCSQCFCPLNHRGLTDWYDRLPVAHREALWWQMTYRTLIKPKHAGPGEPKFDQLAGLTTLATLATSLTIVLIMARR